MANKTKHKSAISFIRRQQLNSGDFECFYYKDLKLDNIISHCHSHYECYFFLEGNVVYSVENQLYDLKARDFLMIPPNTVHHPKTIDEKVPYRRFVLWLHKDFLDKMSQIFPEVSFGFDFSKENREYHFNLDYFAFNDLFVSLLDLWQENNENLPFKNVTCINHILTILLKINRIIYEKSNKITSPLQKDLSELVFEYINANITEDLTLEQIAEHFFVSKYYVSHIFKDASGISLHQYVIKKRLNACRSAIAAGEPITLVAEKFGFSDYTAFYRAFKKEYGVSPKDYRSQVLLK